MAEPANQYFDFFLLLLSELAILQQCVVDVLFMIVAILEVYIIFHMLHMCPLVGKVVSGRLCGT